MHVTELLVTGYDGDKAVFAASLARGEANVVLTSTDDGRETVVDSARQQVTDVFDEMQQLLARVTHASAAVA